MRKPTYNQDHDIRWRVRTATGWFKAETLRPQMETPPTLAVSADEQG